MTEQVFTGFGPSAVSFYAGLEADNSRSYFQAHRDTYQSDIAAPMAALAAGLQKQFGPVSVFRPHRDLRFSADKRPYHEYASLAAHPVESGGDLYLQLGADGLLLAAGQYSPSREQLEAFRRAVDDPARYAQLQTLRTDLQQSGFELDTTPGVKTAPRGWPRDHPHVELLRLSKIIITRHEEPQAWLDTPEALTRITDSWRTATHFTTWLATIQ